MFRNLRKSSFLVASIVVGWVGAGVLAVPLPPGGSVSLSGVSGGAGPGTVIHDEGIEFEIRSSGGALLYEGVLQNRVVRLDATGTLSFLYRIRDTRDGLNGAVHALLTEAFEGFLTDVEFSTTSLGTIGPARAQRAADGSRVTFDFSPEPVFSGAESRFVHITTEAVDFARGGKTVLRLGTGDEVSLPTVQPVRDVEPGCRTVDFEDLPLGAAFPFGSAFASNGVLLRVHEFFFGPGGCVNPFTGGSARVDDGGMACGSGKELQVGNVNVEIEYGVPVTGMTLRYGEYGGNVNLQINGECVNAANFADMPPVIGGVELGVDIFDAPGQGCGRLHLTGEIHSIRIGGQELWIDDIECRPDPCANDTEPPVAEITAPPEFTCVCDRVEVIGTADDDNFDRYILQVRAVGSGVWTTIAGGNTPVLNDLLGVWNTAGLSQGYYVLRLTVTDICGHANTAVRVVWLGTEFDNLTVRSPDDGGIYGGRICFDGTVWDNFCFDEYVVEFMPQGGTTWMPVDPANPVYTSTVLNDPFATWDTIGLGNPDGDYVVRVTARDDCGNTAQESRKVVVDNTPPTAVITSPEPCSCHEGVVEIRGTADDANLASWSVQYTGDGVSGWVTIASGNTPVIDDVLARWDTTRLPPCAYTLRLVITDEAIVNCNSAIRHRSDFNVSLNIGTCGNCDTDNDGDVDLDDHRTCQQEFTGPG